MAVVAAGEERKKLLSSLSPFLLYSPFIQRWPSGNGCGPRRVVKRGIDLDQRGKTRSFLLVSIGGPPSIHRSLTSSLDLLSRYPPPKKKTGGRAPDLPRPLRSLLPSDAGSLRRARLRDRPVPGCRSAGADSDMRARRLEAFTQKKIIVLFLYHLAAAAAGTQRARPAGGQRDLVAGRAADAGALPEGGEGPAGSVRFGGRRRQAGRRRSSGRNGSGDGDGQRRRLRGPRRGQGPREAFFTGGALRLAPLGASGLLGRRGASRAVARAGGLYRRLECSSSSFFFFLLGGGKQGRDGRRGARAAGIRGSCDDDDDANDVKLKSRIEIEMEN